MREIAQCSDLGQHPSIAKGFSVSALDISAEVVRRARCAGLNWRNRNTTPGHGQQKEDCR
jgi:hypothetical protein